MSGGHFAYRCFNITEFAAQLEREIKSNDECMFDEYGDRRGYGFNAETMNRLKASHRLIKAAGDLAKEIEWLYSSDIGEEDFIAAFDKMWSNGLGVGDG